jgi:hypothetical protein
LYSGPEPPVDPTCKNVPSYVKHCEKFKWACTDSRYPYFRENCKKTCNACNDYWGIVPIVWSQKVSRCWKIKTQQEKTLIGILSSFLH